MSLGAAALSAALKEIEMKDLYVGDDILYTVMNPTAGIAGGGDGHPFAGQIVRVLDGHKRVNIMFWDDNGISHARQDVPLMRGGDTYPGGDYAILKSERVDPEAAARALHGQTTKSPEQVKAESTRSVNAGEGGAAPLPQNDGDASTDPANTAAGQMSETQRAEGRNAGLPTTGGLTPTISADSVADLSERDRELLAQQPSWHNGQTKAISEALVARDEPAKVEAAPIVAKKTAKPKK